MFLDGLVFRNADASFYLSGDSTKEIKASESESRKLYRMSTETRKPSQVLVASNEILMEVPIALSGSSVLTCGGFGETGMASRSCCLIEHQTVNIFRVMESSPLLVPRGSHGLINCTTNGRVYALGGTWRMGGRNSFRSCEVHDSLSDQWRFVPKMNQARRNFGLTSRGNMLMVFGGFDGEKGILFDSELHDVRTGSWWKGPDVPGLLWNYALA